jgi:hypothetical protein
MARAIKSLSRHRVDLIARAVVSGRRGYGKGVDRVADSIAGLMKNKLEALGAKGAERAWRCTPARAEALDRHLLKVLLDRTAKYLAGC